MNDTSHIKLQCSASEKSLYQLHGLELSFPLECDLCKLQFHNWISFDNHMSSHEECTLIFCRLCEETFKTDDELLAHRAEYHKGQKFLCKQCNDATRITNSEGDVEEITVSIEEDTVNNWECEQFNADPLSDQPLEITTVPVNENMCDEQHVETTECIDSVTKPPNKRAFKCHVCGKTFLKKRILVAHLKLHSAPEFICTFCSKPFCNKFKLLDHTRQHTGERPYKCELCDKAYTSRASLDVHINRSHPAEEKAYTCRFCNKVFTWLHSYNRHLRQVHGQPYFHCRVCTRKFSIQSKMVEHMMSSHSM